MKGISKFHLFWRCCQSSWSARRKKDKVAHRRLKTTPAVAERRTRPDRSNSLKENQTEGEEERKALGSNRCRCLLKSSASTSHAALGETVRPPEQQESLRRHTLHFSRLAQRWRKTSGLTATANEHSTFPTSHSNPAQQQQHRDASEGIYWPRGQRDGPRGQTGLRGVAASEAEKKPVANNTQAGKESVRANVCLVFLLK